jgi:hypothetical protein
MFQYLVEDYLKGYGLPKIRTETNTYRLIFEDKVCTAIEINRGSQWRPTYLPDNIIAIIIRDDWHWLLCSDRTEKPMFHPDRKSSVPANRFQLYLMCYTI